MCRDLFVCSLLYCCWSHAFDGTKDVKFLMDKENENSIKMTLKEA